MKLTKREQEALAEIGHSKSGMNPYFRMKSWPKLIEKGLARKDEDLHGRVHLTSDGIELLIKLESAP